MSMPVSQSSAAGAERARTTARPAAGAPLTILFSITAFTGAALLFVVQPLVAKLLLPSYGGSATVWSTTSLFFQVVLLLAYLYVHLSTRRLGHRWQPRAHLLLLLLPATVLPLALPGDAAPGEEASPALWLLRTLVLMIGLPFAVLATTGPVLQSWFSWSGSHRAGDPYFLFAASNLGSFGGLLAYPLVVEPTLTLHQQRVAWSVGFVVFGLFSAACAVVAARGRPAALASDTPAHEPLDGRRLLAWTALAALPASLSLAVTAHISTDVAAIPLLWVVPLAIYLATFVLAFARGSRKPPRRTLRAACAVTLAAAALVALPGVPILVSITLSLAMLALVGYGAHARLAADRPSPANLTAFYLVVATGGALGGALNGFVAPQLFDRVWEFPLSVVVVPLVLLGVAHPGLRLRTALVLGVAVAFTVGLLLRPPDAVPFDASAHYLVPAVLAMLVGWGLSRVPILLCALLVVRFVAAEISDAVVLDRSRSFFGAYTVEEHAGVHRLIHGTTLHGEQFQDPARANLPTTYYASPGSVGEVFTTFAGRFTDVGVIGLGAGTLAAYGQPGQRMTFFEIDSDMVRTARNPRLFTFLRDSAADIDTVVGDGRLEVEKRPSGSFDLLVLDAFSSDSIPVHLLTREAMRIYADRLAPDGVLAVHVSNRIFDLRPVLAAAARDLGWQATLGRGTGIAPGATTSVWVVLSPDPRIRSTLTERPAWEPLASTREVGWTDSYSSLLAVLD